MLIIFFWVYLLFIMIFIALFSMNVGLRSSDFSRIIVSNDSNSINQIYRTVSNNMAPEWEILSYHLLFSSSFWSFSFLTWVEKINTWVNNSVLVEQKFFCVLAAKFVRLSTFAYIQSESMRQSDSAPSRSNKFADPSWKCLYMQCIWNDIRIASKCI